MTEPSDYSAQPRFGTWSAIKRFVLSVLPPPSAGLIYWREKIFSTLIAVGALSALAVLIPALLFLTEQGRWGLAFLDVLVYVLVLGLLFARRIPFPVRAGATALFSYVLGAGVLISVGPFSGGFAYLAAFPVITGILLGLPAAVAALVLNALTLAGLGWFNAAGLLAAWPLPENPILKWLTTGVNFIFIDTLVTISVTMLIKGLETSFLKERTASASWERAHAQLSEVNRRLKREMEERRRAERALAESEKRYRSVFEQARDAIYLTTPEGRLLDINEAGAQMFGYTRDAIKKVNVADIYARASDRKEALAALEREGFIRDWEAVFVHKDGRVITCLDSAVVWRGENGETLGYIGLLRDITGRKQAEEEKARLERQLRQAQKMEAIGTLAGGIAHDFNNILAAILGSADLGLADLAEDAPQRRHLERILEAGQRAKDLIKQILDFSRLSEPEKKPIRLELIVRQALKLLRATLPTTIDIKTDIRVGDETVMADPTQIHQLLMNLGANAGHAMRESGGVLEVSLETVELDPDQAAGYADLTPGRYQRLAVSDTGHGMDEETAARIFEPFFTTKETGEGTGMGLAVAHGIVVGHGGAIEVHSRPGQGASFVIHLPLAQAALDDDQPLDQTEIKGGGESILLVDDEEMLTELGRERLERLGYRVTALTSSREALALFEADPDRFDLVITDQTMPELTGAEMAAEMLRLRPDTPIILCTGFSSQISPEKARRIGIRRFLMKPTGPETAAIIREVLDEQARARLESPPPEPESHRAK